MIGCFVAYYLVVAGLYASQASATLCTSNLLIDNFSLFQIKKNSLGMKASDDGSMTTISGGDGTISFHPERGSYFYETVPCVDTIASGYGALAFTMKGPPDASVVLEIQTTKSCSDPVYRSAWRYVAGFTGGLQRITVPLSSFVGANANAVDAFNWSTWESPNETDFVWQLGDIELVCSMLV